MSKSLSRVIITGLFPQLQSHGSQVLGSGLIDDLAHGSASGEKDLIKLGIEQRRCFRNLSFHDCEIIGSESLIDHPLQCTAGSRTKFARFQYDGVSGRQGTHYGREGKLDGIVPRADDQCDPQRFRENVTLRGPIQEIGAYLFWTGSLREPPDSVLQILVQGQEFQHEGIER
jgi:hypothetical protein